MHIGSSVQDWIQKHQQDRDRAHRGRWVIACALLLMLIGASIESSTHGVDAVSNSVDPAVTSYAEQYGVDESVSEQRLERIRPMHGVLAEIREAESHRVAGWGIDHGAQMIGWVLLTDDESPNATAQAVADAHADIEIRIGASHSYEELLAAQKAFQGGKGVPSADHSSIISFTAVDMKANALEIGIDPALERLDGPPATDAELQAKVAQLTSDYADRLAYDIRVTDGRGVADHEMFDAGRAMNVCTSGFVAQDNSSDEYGVITAGHCRPGQNQTMHGVTLTFVRGGRNVNADAKFLTVPGGASHTVRSQYKKTSGVEEIHNDVARSAMPGDHVCLSRKQHGVSCGTVTNINYQPSSGNCGPSPCNAVFVRVEGPALAACRGDSGGPWWRYRTAYGIHKGGNNADECDSQGTDYAIFSAVHEVEDFLDVEVLEDTYVEVP